MCILSALKALQDNWEGQMCTKAISVRGRKCPDGHVWGSAEACSLLWVGGCESWAPTELTVLEVSRDSPVWFNSLYDQLLLSCIPWYIYICICVYAVYVCVYDVFVYVSDVYVYVSRTQTWHNILTFLLGSKLLDSIATKCGQPS